MGRVIRLFEGRFGRLALSEVGSEPASSHRERTLLFLYDGEPLEYAMDEERVALTREAILFVKAGRQCAVTSSAAMPSRVLAFHVADEWLLEGFPAAFAPSAQPCTRVSEEITSRIRRLADTLAVEVLNDRFLAAERLEFMLQELVLSIIDSYLARRRTGTALWRGSRFEDSRIRRAIALLRARPNKDYNMDELANQVGLSRSRFYDLFQLCTGFSPRAYLDKLCIETAIARLSTNSGTIGDVAAELGFSAQSNFTRFFLNQVGIPPSEYRRAALKPATAPDLGGQG